MGVPLGRASGLGVHGSGGAAPGCVFCLVAGEKVRTTCDARAHTRISMRGAWIPWCAGVWIPRRRAVPCMDGCQVQIRSREGGTGDPRAIASSWSQRPNCVKGLLPFDQGSRAPKLT